MAHAAFNWHDPFLLDQQLTEDERMVREMGARGLLGPTIPTQYGGPGLNYVAYGLLRVR